VNNWTVCVISCLFWQNITFILADSICKILPFMLLSRVVMYKNIEKYAAKVNKKEDQFLQKWAPTNE